VARQLAASKADREKRLQKTSPNAIVSPASTEDRSRVFSPASEPRQQLATCHPIFVAVHIPCGSDTIDSAIVPTQRRLSTTPVIKFFRRSTSWKDAQIAFQLRRSFRNEL
jgi:hypothetical protein